MNAKNDIERDASDINLLGDSMEYEDDFYSGY